MINQSSREVIYFRIPIVIADLIIHVTILFALMKMLPTNTVNEVLAYSVRVGTILMLALSFSFLCKFVQLGCTNEISVFR